MKKLVAGTAAIVGMTLAASPAMAVDELIAARNYDGPDYIAPGIGVAASDLDAELTATNPIGGWSGKFGSMNSTNLASLTLSNLPTHSGISISFILGFMDSWDSYNGGCCSPDILSFFIDGNLVAQMTYNNALGSIKDIDDATLLSEYGQHGASSNFYSDTLIDLTGASFLNFSHTADTITFGIQAGGAGWQGGSDESWGIDDIKVTLRGVERGAGPVPEPGTWAMMIAGFGAVGFAMRRRQKVAVSFA